MTQLDQLQDATLTIMERTGVKFPSEKALKVLAEHGARVDFENTDRPLPPRSCDEVSRQSAPLFQHRCAQSFLRFPPGRWLHLFHHRWLRRGNHRPGDPPAASVLQGGRGHDGARVRLPAFSRLLLADGQLAGIRRDRTAARPGCRFPQHSQAHPERDHHGRGRCALCSGDVDRHRRQQGGDAETA